MLKCSTGIEVRVFAVDLHQRNVSIQVPGSHDIGLEEMIVARSNPDRRGIEACRPREAHEKQGNFVAVSIAAFPNILDIAALSFLGAPLFLFWFFNFISGIAYFLDPSIALLQL